MAYLLFCHSKIRGLAIKIVEYIPEIKPTIRQNAKLLSTTPPHTNNATAVKSVVRVVNTVLPRV